MALYFLHSYMEPFFRMGMNEAMFQAVGIVCFSYIFWISCSFTLRSFLSYLKSSDGRVSIHGSISCFKPFNSYYHIQNICFFKLLRVEVLNVVHFFFICGFPLDDKLLEMFFLAPGLLSFPFRFF